MKIGFDIGGSHIAIGAIDNSNKIAIKHEKEIKIGNYENPEETLLDNMIMLTEEVIKELNISNIELIGIASPGTIRDGKIIRAENLSIRETNVKNNIDIVSSLKSKFKTNVYLRNDAKCAGLAEKQIGSIKNYKDAVFLVLGTGVGGAVFLDGKLLEPKRNCGFELGHMVIDKNGQECTCGRKGCFETIASMKRLKTNIIRKLNLKEETTGVEIRKLLENKDIYTKVEDVIDEYIYNLGIGIANLINIFEPEVISIGGSFVYYKELLIDKLNNELKKKNAIFNQDSIPMIVVAELENDAGIIGATVV